MKTKIPSICSTLYNGDLTISFECSGETYCSYALCETMPPDENSVCPYKEYGACRSTSAQFAALEKLKIKISREINKIKEEVEG